jgi:DNA-binding beta-propeller fold protein YncE
VKKNLCFLLFLLVGIYSAATEAHEPVAWIVNTGSATLSRIDLATGVVQGQVVALGQYANDIAILGDTAYVVNSGDAQVQIIDLANGSTKGVINLTPLSFPYYICIADNRAYVTCSTSGQVAVIDLLTRQWVDTVQVLTGGLIEGVLVHQNTLYVSNANYPTYVGELYMYSLPDLNPLGMIQVASNPQVIKMGPDGNIHLVCTGDYGSIPGQIDIIDPQTHQRIDSIMIGGTPGSLTFNKLGTAFLGAAGDASIGYVLSYNGINRQILHSQSNPIQIATDAMGVAAIDSNHFLVCSFLNDQVIELGQDGTVLRSFDVGLMPLALAIQWPDTATAVRPEARSITYSLATWSYPEPFNGMTMISFTLGTQQHATLKVFDALGKLIDSRDLGLRQAGETRLSYQPATMLSSGKYFYRVEAGKSVGSGEMIYLK